MFIRFTIFSANKFTSNIEYSKRESANEVNAFNMVEKKTAQKAERVREICRKRAIIPLMGTATMKMTTMTAKSLSLCKLDEGCRKWANRLNSPILNKFCKWCASRALASKNNRERKTEYSWLFYASPFFFCASQSWWQFYGPKSFPLNTF